MDITLLISADTILEKVVEIELTLVAFEEPLLEEVVEIELTLVAFEEPILEEIVGTGSLFMLIIITDHLWES
jgi:hypothetical protein